MNETFQFSDVSYIFSDEWDKGGFALRAGADVQVGADGAEAGGEVRGHLRRYDLTQALGTGPGQQDGHMRPG